MSSFSYDPYGQSSSTSGYNPYPKVKKRAQTQLTTTQLLQLIYEKNHTKPHRSFIGDVVHGGGSGLSWTLDKLMRPVHGTAGAFVAARQFEDQLQANHVNQFSWKALKSEFGPAGVGAVAHGFSQGIKGKEHKTFSNYLDAAHVLQNHKVLRGATGFALDVALDPTTYITFGTSSLAKGAAAKSAERVMSEGATVRLSAKTAAARAKELKPHVTTLKHAGDNFAHRAALGQERVNVLLKIAKGVTPDLADMKDLNMARSWAKAEDKLFTPRGPHIGFAGAKTKPLPVRMPSMENIGGAKIPVFSKAVDTTGRYLVPGYKDRLWHAAEIGHKHQAEQLTSRYLEGIRQILEPVSRKLSHDQQLEVLHFFEKVGNTPAVIKKATGEFVLNPTKLAQAKKAGFSDHQLAFVQGMHNVGEFLAAHHREFNLDIKHVGEKGQIYVPHVIDKKTGEVILADKYGSLLSERGFQKARRGEFTLKELHDLHKAGHLAKPVVTDPFELAAHAARAAAHKHADQTLVQYVTKAVGIPRRVVDKSAVLGTQGRIAEVTRKLAEHPAASNGTFESALKQSLADVAENRAMGLKSDFQAAVRENTAKIKHHLDSPWHQTTMATVRRLSTHSETLKARHAAELAAIQAGEHPAVLKAQAKLAKEAVVKQEEFAALQSELKTLAKKLDTQLKGKKNRAYDAAHHATPGDVSVGGRKILNEYGHKVAFPKEIAHSVTRLEKVISGDHETLVSFSAAYHKWLGKWKLGVTSVSPGYGVRNTLSDFWNMWLRSPGAALNPIYGAKAARIMRQAKKEDPEAIQYMLDAYDHGILSGLFPGDIQQVRNMLAYAGSKTSLLKQARFLRLFTKTMQDVNRNRENWGRMTHYVYLRDHGHSVQDAADIVKGAHFDYEDLTKFEQQKMKAIAPFYTWTRKNVPYQVKMLVSAPGRYAAFPKLAEESTQAAGGDQADVPGFLNQSMAFRIPGGGYIQPMIGVSDLMKLDPHNLGNTVSGLASPFFKVPAELLANKNFYTGQAITDPTGHPRKPFNAGPFGITEKLLSMLPGSNVGMTERNGVQQVGANPKWLYLLNQFGPSSNLLLKGGPISKNQGSNSAVRSWLTGVNVSHPDPAMQQLVDRLKSNDAFQGWLRGLRDENKVPEPKKRKKSHNQKILDTALLNAYGG